MKQQYYARHLFFLTLILPFLSSLIAQQGYTPDQGFRPQLEVPIMDQSLAVDPQMSKASSRRDAVPARLAQMLQDELDEARSSLDIKGLSAAVMISGGDTWQGASGKSSDFPSEDVTPEMLFGVGSVSKTFIAACVMDLVEDGKLNLTDSLHHWLPSYPNINSNITLKQLLNHTGGIYNFTNHPDFADSLNADPARIWTPDELLTRFVDAPDFSPGNGWNYSNTGFVLAGMIIEAATGNPYYEEIRTRFLTHLGMTQTVLWPHEALPNPSVHLWQDQGGTLVDLMAQNYPLEGLFSAAGAAGAYYSTAEDMALWVHKLYRGDLLSGNSLQEITNFISIGGGFSYGLGTMRRPYSGLEAWGHGGDIIFGSRDYFVLAEDLGIAVHTNDGRVTSIGVGPIVDSLLNAYLRYQVTASLDQPSVLSSFSTYPNPFSQSLHLDYTLTEAADIQVIIRDVVGREMIHQNLPAQVPGDHSWSWDSTTVLPSEGIYFVEIRVDGRRVTRQVVKR